MKKSNKSVRGAVSVFLVMILVPCLVVSSVFVDLGRVHMSKSMAESAADLALNSLLTNYDADLNEWYGMMASCQNIEDFYSASAQFFLRTISSQGLSDDEIVLLSDYYANITDDETIYDLLKIECQTALSDMIKSEDKAANIEANLSNPTLIKDQIVEFMKYRAPIEITTDLISKFKDSDGNVTEEASSVVEGEKNKELVEKKQEFFEAEGELLKAAYKSYRAIMDYYDDAKIVPLNNKKLTDYAKTINDIKTIYKSVHAETVKNLLNTSDLSVYSRVTYSIDQYKETYTSTSKDVHTEIKDGVYYISGARITSLLSELDTNIKDFEKKKGEFTAACNDLMGKTVGNDESEANPLQWWVQMNYVLNVDGSTTKTKAYSDAAEKMLKSYAKVLAIKDCTVSGDDIPEDWETKYDEYTQKVRNLHENYLVAGAEKEDDAYLKAVNKLETVSKTYDSYRDSSKLNVSINGQVKTVDAWIQYTYNELDKLHSSLSDRVNELTLIIDGNENEKDEKYIPSLDKLAQLAKTYNENLNDWKNVANQKDTELKKSDSKEIEGLTLEKQITEASVNELKQRLLNIKNQLQTLIDGIESMLYGSKKVVEEIKSFTKFKERATTKVETSKIQLINKSINDYADKTFEELFEPTTSVVVTLSNTNSNKYNPDINPEDTGVVDTPALFKYFYSKFKDVKNDEYKKGEDDEKKAKEEVENYEKEQLTLASKYRGDGSDISITFSSSDKSYSAGTNMVGSVAGLIKDIINGNFDNIRDDIYVTSYITNMFSYATQDREIKYSLLNDTQKGAFSPFNYGAYNLPEIVGAADKEKTALSEILTDSYNKSLTNKMFKKENNVAYLAEIEYILYGQGTNQENLSKSFGDIYTMRFVLNTVSAFQHYWSDTTIIKIAGLVSSLFCGVVPVPVIKAVLLPILAALETCMDNSRLSYGMPVELYKAKDDWWLSLPNVGSFSEFFSSLKENKPLNKNKDKGFFYSEYLMLFVYTGLSGGGELEENMYKRIAEVIQTNIGKLSGVNDYSLKKSIVYFELSATVRVKPLMVTLPIFNDYSNNMNTKKDWCTYTIKLKRGYS